MKAIVDEDLCFGCGVCQTICPEVFEMGDDNKAKVKLDPVPSAFHAACREAAEGCPEEAIRIEEQSGQPGKTAEGS